MHFSDHRGGAGAGLGAETARPDGRREGGGASSGGGT